jgi:hypothetical protein
MNLSPSCTASRLATRLSAPQSKRPRTHRTRLHHLAQRQVHPRVAEDEVAVECFAVLELDQHGVALRRVQKPEGQLEDQRREVSRSVRTLLENERCREKKQLYHLEKICVPAPLVFGGCWFGRWTMQMRRAGIGGKLQGARQLDDLKLQGFGQPPLIGRPTSMRLRWGDLLRSNYRPTRKFQS